MLCSMDQSQTQQLEMDQQVDQQRRQVLIRS